VVCRSYYAKNYIMFNVLMVAIVFPRGKCWNLAENAGTPWNAGTPKEHCTQVQYAYCN
jgi:hypothetical protein